MSLIDWDTFEKQSPSQKQMLLDKLARGPEVSDEFWPSYRLTIVAMPLKYANDTKYWSTDRGDFERKRCQTLVSDELSRQVPLLPVPGKERWASGAPVRKMRRGRGQ